MPYFLYSIRLILCSTQICTLHPKSKLSTACLIFRVRSHIAYYCQILLICAKLAEFSRFLSIIQTNTSRIDILFAHVLSRNVYPDRRMPVTILTIPLPLASISWRRYLSRAIIIFRVLFLWLSTNFHLQK